MAFRPLLATSNTLDDWRTTLNDVLTELGDSGLDAYAALADNETITGTWTFNNPISVGANTVLTTGDEGAGNGLDADTVDTYEASALLSRANHTGTQTASTISDFSEAVDDRVGTLVVGGTNVDAVYDGAGTLTLSVSSTGLDADTLDGQEGSFYQNASNLNAGSVPDAQVSQSSVVQHEAALTILESQIAGGGDLARVSDNETITGTWTFNNTIDSADVEATYQKKLDDSGTDGIVFVKDPFTATTDAAEGNGTLVIVLPHTNTGNGLHLVLQGSCEEHGAYIVEIYGNNASGGWTDAHAHMQGSSTFQELPVRFGNDGTNDVILLGDVDRISGTTERLSITDLFVSGDSSTEDWTTGWSLTTVTDETGYTIDVEAPIIRVSRGSDAFDTPYNADLGAKAFTDFDLFSLYPETKADGAYTVVRDDHSKVVRVDGDVTLPDPVLLDYGWGCIIKNKTAGAIDITPSTGTLDGNASESLNSGDSAIVSKLDDTTYEYIPF